MDPIEDLKYERNAILEAIERLQKKFPPDHGWHDAAMKECVTLKGIADRMLASIRQYEMFSQR